jgi:putative component of toxin-antitoxin plasmid stabilization module
MIELFRYQSDDDCEPFTEWLNALRDKVAQARIRAGAGIVQPMNFRGQAARLCGVDLDPRPVNNSI